MGAWSREYRSDSAWWSRELEEIYGLEKDGFKGTREDFLALPERERLQLLLEFANELPDLPERYASAPGLLERIEECQSPVRAFAGGRSLCWRAEVLPVGGGHSAVAAPMRCRASQGSPRAARTTASKPPRPCAHP